MMQERERPHPPVALAGNDAEAVVFDLVQPLAAGGQLIGFGWEARRDQAGREKTRRHADLIELSNGDCDFNSSWWLSVEPVDIGARMSLNALCRPHALLRPPSACST